MTPSHFFSLTHSLTHSLLHSLLQDSIPLQHLQPVEIFVPSEAARAAALAAEGATNSGPLSGIFADWGGAWNATANPSPSPSPSLNPSPSPSPSPSPMVALPLPLIRRVELDGREEHGRCAQGGPAAGRSHLALPQQLMPQVPVPRYGGATLGIACGDLVCSGVTAAVGGRRALL